MTETAKPELICEHFESPEITCCEYCNAYPACPLHSDKRGLNLEWRWEVETAVSCLVLIANGGPWQEWTQHQTDTRGIVTERAAKAIHAALKVRR